MTSLSFTSGSLQAAVQETTETSNENEGSIKFIKWNANRKDP